MSRDRKQQLARRRQESRREAARVKHTHSPFVGRTCGACSFCCTSLGVHLPADQGGDKNPGVPCRHLGPGGSGCSIYAHRPHDCARFQCGWIEGGRDLALDSDRPDLLGVMFWITAEGEQRQMIQVHEVWEGAAQSPRAQEIFRSLRSKGASIGVVPPGERPYGEPIMTQLLMPTRLTIGASG